jgi:hypothetical protein
MYIAQKEKLVIYCQWIDSLVVVHLDDCIVDWINPFLVITLLYLFLNNYKYIIYYIVIGHIIIFYIKK